MSFDESRLNELKAALREKTTANKEIADSFQTEGGVLVIEADRKTAFDKNMAEIREIKGLIKDLEDLRTFDETGQQPANESVAAELAAKGIVADGAKTLGQMFLDSPEFKTISGGRNGYNMPTAFELAVPDLASFNFKDVYSALPSGTPGSFGTVARDPIVERAHRKTRVRDLFPIRSTSAAVIEYFRVTGFTNNASVVPERDGSDFASKPQSNLTIKGEQSPVRTIAHWEAAHRNVLADEPQLRGIIDNELLYGLRLEEDAQILSGTGTGEDLAGILTNSDIQEYSWSDGLADPVDNKADAIRRALTLAFLAHYEPTGVVLHPNDWEDIELTKNDQGSYLMAVSIQSGAEARIWRLPVIDTPAIAEGTALVGAFGTGAQLYDREQATVRITDSHADFFVKNAIVVLAEERLALAVKRPESFVEVTFDAAPS